MEDDNRAAIPQETITKTRILVVEDNIMNQRLDAFVLGNWGFTYRICDNGVSALALLIHEKWDLVLMDICLPEIDGCDTTLLVRRDLGLDVPIIGVTACPSEQEKEKCFALGMNGYISKPVNEEELYALVRRFLVPETTYALASK